MHGTDVQGQIEGQSPQPW